MYFSDLSFFSVSVVVCVFSNYTVSKAFLLLMNKRGSVGAFSHFGLMSV